MKLLSCLPFYYVVLVLLTLNNGVNNIPISAGYSLHDFYSNEGAELTAFKEKQDCLKPYKDEEDKVDATSSDVGSKINCKPEMSSDYNAMSKDVPVLNQSTDKNLPHNNKYNKTCIRNRSFEYNKLSPSEINILVSSYNFSYGTNNLIFEQSDDNVGATIPDDIIYGDMPGILIFYIIHDDGEAHSIEGENAVEVTSD
jgi:hypothetical protein